MPGLRVDSCCCGCTLRTGTIAIGYYFAITGFIGAVICFGAISLIHEPEPPLKPEVDAGLVKGIFITAGVIMLIQMLTAIALLIGVYKGKTGIMLPWLVVNGIYLLFGVVGIIMMIVVAAQSREFSLFSSVAGECINVALILYFMVVVHSYRMSVLEGYAVPANP